MTPVYVKMNFGSSSMETLDLEEPKMQNSDCRDICQTKCPIFVLSSIKKS